MSDTATGITRAHTEHPRHFRENRFVYPVVSRRSRGVSIGINLNPDQVCNFDCVYCQVDRSIAPGTRYVDVEQLLAELDTTLDLVTSGALFEEPEFRDVPPALRRLEDIAFSGDGEPTSFPGFEEVVSAVADLRRRQGLADDVRLVLITNASLFDRPRVRRALEVLDRERGEIWAKLDAGTVAYFREIDRAGIPFERLLRNLLEAARARPIVLQTMLLRLRGEPPSAAEIEAYCDRLAEIRAGGGRIDRVQLYTVARPPAEAEVAALEAEALESIAETVRRRAGVPVETFPGRA